MKEKSTNSKENFSHQMMIMNHRMTAMVKEKKILRNLLTAKQLRSLKVSWMFRQENLKMICWKELEMRLILHRTSQCTTKRFSKEETGLRHYTGQHRQCNYSPTIQDLAASEDVHSKICVSLWRLW